MIRRLYWGVMFNLSRATALAICEPKLRLGRRRHDGNCDECGERCSPYAMEKLDFPIESLEPEATSSREKLRAMFSADYVRYCLECGNGIETEQAGVDDAE
ncbi:hypothetical protein [Natronosalvus halobius]|uniref:hypothetical protein n=1 Tax=Natronosalvus halobius TaxID=2953746 RepID=UPI00209FD64C|nr:hypothetical protein [Natronosalvus halobius]USZ73773.1 hypothetical protein NGM15_18375 [Natronosalvus halobius]